MASFHILYSFHEVECTKHGDYIKEYETHLPHAKTIAKNAENSWNSLPMHQYFDGILKDKIESCTMKCRVTPYNELVGNITIKATPGFRLTSKVKDEIDDQISAQLSDGWGESFFGLVNIMEDNNNYFYVD